MHRNEKLCENAWDAPKVHELKTSANQVKNYFQKEKSFANFVCIIIMSYCSLVSIIFFESQILRCPLHFGIKQLYYLCSSGSQTITVNMVIWNKLKSKLSIVMVITVIIIIIVSTCFFCQTSESGSSSTWIVLVIHLSVFE